MIEFAAIDHHAHNLLKPEIAQKYAYAAFFTEGYDPEIINHHARHTLFYYRSLREIAQLLNCEATEAAILERRQELGLEKLADCCFKAANLEAIFLDDGFFPSEVFPWQWHQNFVKVKRVLRLEYLAEQLIPRAENCKNFLEAFRSEIDPPPREVVAFKSIVSYRTGLNIDLVSLEVAESSFEQVKQACQEKPCRLNNKHLIDFLLIQALEIANKYRIPIQFHTGFGDPDLDLKLSNPLYLRPLLEDKRWQNAPIILLHASYPYTREGGYLASVYPQIYLDTGLAVPFLSVAGMRSCVQQLLELTPTTKLMYSSDAHHIPELYYLAAKWGRKILADVLEAAIKDTDLTAKQVDLISKAILSENARHVYQLYN
ncbi:amidohydrolase family protein [Gloeothece verrucosa]|uniref:Amidohydrolase 2 n=1 Tax=Gloeothece verrucosa (strain PCC 7822) TaxID=497965 RepID=E0U9F6_GLOV7|nr:amidohydrolase family protein [Gloeothece verrucosa]ADN12648.1 amidohydrolase 2 [Gloeothece verrucosa PCC 7822]